MPNLIEETIIFLVDVSAPAAQAGKKGDVRTVGRDITNYAANWLLRGGQVRRIRKDQVRDVLIEIGLIKPEPAKETKPKAERRNRGGKRTDNRGDKERNTGSPAAG